MGMISEKKAASAVAAASSPVKTLQSQINLMQNEIKTALPSVITPERFTRIFLKPSESAAQSSL